MPVTRPDSNGRLTQAIQKARQGTDDAGSPKESKEKIVRGATMADAAKKVASLQFLLKGWIPKGMVTGVIAEPGVGKSAWVLFALVKPIVTGGTWFDGRRGPKKLGKVLWLSTENDMAITIHRTKNWNIPTENIILPFEDDPLGSVNLANTEHLLLIENLINGYGTALVVVDSLRGGHDGDENNSQVGKVLKALAEIAERTGAAVVVVYHTRKLTDGEEISANSSRGSNAILAMMRAQIGIDNPDPKSRWCRVRVLKENLGLAPEPFGFLVSDKGLEYGPAPEKKKEKTEQSKAENWLKQNMVSGQWFKAAEMIESATGDGFSESVISRARNVLGIVKPHHIRKTGGEWEWKLP